LNSPEELSK